MMATLVNRGGRGQNQHHRARPVAAVVLALLVGALVLVGAPSVAAQSGTDLSVMIVADRSTANAGRVVTYTVTISNVGDATAIGVALFVGCYDNLQCDPVSGSVPESLEPGVSVAVTMTATANPCGLSITRDAKVLVEVSPTDSNRSNNYDEVTIRLQKCHQK
jgi:hypothetical protein